MKNKEEPTEEENSYVYKMDHSEWDTDRHR